MKQIKKALLLVLRYGAHRCKAQRLYYWADDKLHKLRTVYLMPMFVYNGLFRVSMWLNGFRPLQRLADRTIHYIPFHVRFRKA